MRIFRSIPDVKGEKSKVSPSTSFLIILNGLLFFSLCVISSNILGLILAIPLSFGFILASGIPHLFFRLVVEKKRFLAPFPRIAVYTSPFLVICVLLFLLPSSAQKVNQTSPLVSPSGKYQVTVSSPAMGWKFIIETTDKEQRWELATFFAPQFNVYWVWDTEDRLWTYNSDDGGVAYFSNEHSEWRQREWHADVVPATDLPAGIRPPDLLYPDYARKER